MNINHDQFGGREAQKYVKVEGRRNGNVSYEMLFWVVCWGRVAGVGRGAEGAAVRGYHSRETVGVVDVAF